MLSAMLRLVFCFLRIWISVSGSGLSMPTKTREEVRILHRLQHIVVVGNIDRGFGRELERIVVLLQPSLSCGINGRSLRLPMKLSSTKSTWPR